MLRHLGRMLLRLLVPAALVIDAVVHLHLAHGYQGAQSGGIGEGTIFRIESALALASAAWVLIRGSRASFACAFLVALTAVAAVVIYRYVDVPSFGPIPSMYEPIWFSQKTHSALAEAIGSALAAAGFLLAPAALKPQTATTVDPGPIRRSALRPSGRGLLEPKQPRTPRERL